MKSKFDNQLALFDKNSEERRLPESDKSHKTKKVKGQFKYQEDSKWYHRFRIETKNEEILGAIYISKTMNPLPDRIILDRKGD